MAAYQRYPRPLYEGTELDLDYEAMASDYDGLNLTKKGIQEAAGKTLREKPFRNIMGWKVESTLWFRWTFLEVREYHRRRTPRQRPQKPSGEPSA